MFMHIPHPQTKRMRDIHNIWAVWWYFFDMNAHKGVRWKKCDFFK